MPMSPVFEENLIDDLLPEHVLKCLGLQHQSVLDALLNVEGTRTRVTARLEDVVGALEDPEDIPAEIAHRFFALRGDEKMRFLRICVALTQAFVVRATTRGDVFSTLVTFCGERSILNWMRDMESCTPVAVPPMEEPDVGELEAGVAHIDRLITALLPESWINRMRLRVAEDNFAEPLVSSDPSNKAALIELLGQAFAFLDSLEGKHA